MIAHLQHPSEIFAQNDKGSQFLNSTLKVKVLVIQSCPTLWPMDCSLPSSSSHGILQAKILEWAAISFSRDFFSSQPRDWTQVSRIAGRFVTDWPSPYISSRHPRETTQKLRAHCLPSLLGMLLSFRNKIFVFWHCILHWCAVGENTEQISPDKR